MGVSVEDQAEIGCADGGVSWSKDPMSFELAATKILDEEVQQHVFGDIIGRKITATAKVTW